MGRHPILSADDEIRLCFDYISGYTPTRLSVKYKIASVTVWKILKNTAYRETKGE